MIARRYVLEREREREREEVNQIEINALKKLPRSSSRATSG